MTIAKIQTVEEEKIIKSYPEFMKLIALALGFVMATLDATVVNVAGADIQRNLEMSLSELTWVIDGYILTFASLLLLGGTLAVRYGAKTIYLLGLILFVMASLFSALSPNGGLLITCRLIQGAGAALFMPSSLSLLAGAFLDENKRAKMIGLWSAIVSIASGLGPFIGGVLVHFFGWQSIFLINIPLGLTGLIMTWRLIKDSKKEQKKINVVNHGLGILALALLSYSTIEYPHYGWNSHLIQMLSLLTLIILILFIYVEKKGKNPIFPHGLFQNRHFTYSNVIGFLLNFSLFGGIFTLGLFLQYGRGVSPLIAGVEMLPMMIVFVIGNILYSYLSQKISTLKLMRMALIMASLGTLLLTWCRPEVPYWYVAVVYSMTNLGVGITVPALTQTLLNAAGSTNAHIASATLNANRQIGALLGVAIASITLNSSPDWYVGSSLVFLVSAITYLLALLISFYLIKERMA